MPEVIKFAKSHPFITINKISGYNYPTRIAVIHLAGCLGAAGSNTVYSN
ncbi:MAG: hypothetical protein JST09_11965 [Bacteroidetes bacterium]|nr:hypothetical protein [Bacteroidota bacterium]